MSRPKLKTIYLKIKKLIKTCKFYKCQDRDSSGLANFINVKTETHQDLQILKLIETGKGLELSRLERIVVIETNVVLLM